MLYSRSHMATVSIKGLMLPYVIGELIRNQIIQCSATVSNKLLENRAELNTCIAQTVETIPRHHTLIAACLRIEVHNKHVHSPHVLLHFAA